MRQTNMSGANAAKIGRSLAAGLRVMAALLFANITYAQSWVQHQDKNGFRLSHPPGWVVETPDDKTVFAHSADGSSVVLIHAFFEKTNVGAKQWLQQVPAKFGSVFGRSKFGQIRDRRSQSDDALGQMEYFGRWGDCKASLLVSIHQGAGML